jgi:hypothetical protein
MTDESVPPLVRERLAVLEQQISTLARAPEHGGGLPLPDMTPVAIQLVLREMRNVVRSSNCAARGWSSSAASVSPTWT